MPVTEADVLAALSRVSYPGFTRNIVAFGVHAFDVGAKGPAQKTARPVRKTM